MECTPTSFLTCFCWLWISFSNTTFCRMDIYGPTGEWWLHSCPHIPSITQPPPHPFLLDSNSFHALLSQFSASAKSTFESTLILLPPQHKSTKPHLRNHSLMTYPKPCPWPTYQPVLSCCTPLCSLTSTHNDIAIWYTLSSTWSMYSVQDTSQAG